MRTILFDLDGTLLPMDMERFTKNYFVHLAESFADLIDGRELARQVLAATEQMVRTRDGRTNETVFLEYFGQNISGDLAVYRERFDAFYDSAFLRLQSDFAPNPHMVDSVAVLKAKGYRLAVATNPIFPLKANLHRIGWAGLDAGDFCYISCFEKNRFCKPHIEYYEEVLSAVGESPDRCLMVGNDVQEDLPAGQLGMKTFLVEDCLLHRGGAITADHRGSSGDFHRFALTLPSADL